MTAHVALDPNAPIMSQIRAVSGTVVDGTADDLTPPVKIGGVDGSGNVQTVLFGTDGSLSTGGGVASGVADTGNPVKVGGVYNSTKPTFTNGQRGDLQVTTRGALAVTLLASDSATPLTVNGALGDGNSTTVTAMGSIGYGLLFNGTTWDRQRGTSALVVLASGARTTTQTSAALTNYNHRGIRVVVNTTVIGTGSITLSITGTDANGITYTLLSGAAIITNTTNVYTLSPNIATVANVSLADHLPRTYGVVVTANNANSATYSVASELLL